MQPPCAAVPLSRPALMRRGVDFTRAAWAAGLRADERGPAQLRPVAVDFPLPARNVARVRCGGTVVIATAADRLVEPHPRRPRHGMLNCNVRQNPTERDVQAQSQARRQLAAFLERVIKGGGVLDTESLCVLPGRRVWSITIDVVVLNDEGNTTDAAVWATMALLLHYRRPEITVRGNNVIVHPPHERDPVPLSIHHTPLSFGFVITAAPGTREKLARKTGTDVSETALDVVVDPTVEESLAAAATLVVAINAEGQVCAVSKTEGCCIRVAELNQCIQTASILAPRVMELIRDAMAAHDAKRQKTVKGQFLWAQKRAGVSRVEEPETAKKKKEES
ncbi:Exoribonuclease [Trypanosoma melophagium]|uniref:Exoribonuclease n=1 Tax=Trypanosoma melophagium TaxID=715481 RepID=UPI003519FE01|nr:Exoribonuclease [Trypanosoma melophagium]